jgi:hypothetical protein
VVYDSQRRPITAGGFVDSGPTVFQDVTERAGLGAWRHVMGTPEKKYILEADGSGVGLIDCDNDGYISANDQRLHFGLGDSTTVETVEIRWPDGTRETIKLPGVDRIFSTGHLRRSAATFLSIKPRNESGLSQTHTASRSAST